MAAQFKKMHWKANGPCFVKDRPGDGLSDPPACIGAELVAFGVIETEDGPHKAKVAFLNEVCKA